jgi:hypothetical protein
MVHGVAPVQPITSVGTVTDAVDKLRMEAVEAIEEGRVAAPQETRRYNPGLPLGTVSKKRESRRPKRREARRYNPGLPLGTVLWEEPHGAIGIGVQDEFRRGGPQGGADIYMSKPVDATTSYTESESQVKTNMSRQTGRAQSRKY